MATQGSTYGQAIPTGSAAHRKLVATLAAEAKARRQSGQSTGRKRNAARRAK